MRITVGAVALDADPRSTVSALRQRAFEAGACDGTAFAADILLFKDGRGLDPGATLQDEGLEDGDFVSAVKERCQHGSPFDPGRGGYLCGWC